MHSTILMLLIAALLGGGLAIAQQSTPEEASAPKRPKYLTKFDDKFRAADTDGDGALTREEAARAGMGRIVENFDRLDVDKDGKITREELRALIRSKLSS